MDSHPPRKLRHAEFEALYRRHSREVWAIAYARYLNADVALDVAQEAFLRLWKHYGDGGEIVNPRAWLFRVARNLVEDHAKSAFHRNGTHPPELMNAVRAPSELPLDGLERREVSVQVKQELAELSERDREILTLRYALEYSPNDIAAILETTVTAVHMRLSRARQRLAERLLARGVAHYP
jgi:RNA polymerase sigma-70 factor (ECF subfamily)